MWQRKAVMSRVSILIAVLLMLSIVFVVLPGTAMADNFGSLTDNGTAAYMGIGTATPERPLHLFGQACLFERDRDSAGFIIKRTAVNRWVFGVDEAPTSLFVIKTYPEGQPATVRMVIDTSGRVGIGTTSPGTLTKLHAVNDNTSTNRVAIFGETAGGNTAGVSGVNIDAGTMGFLGGQAFDEGAGAFGGYYNTGTATLRDWGALGTDSSGVFGQWGASGPSGFLGNSNYGAYGSYGSNNGCLGSATCGVQGNGSSDSKGVFGTSDTGWGVDGYSTSGAGVHGGSGASGKAVEGINPNPTGYAGYFDGRVYVTGDMTVLGEMSKGGGTFKIDHPLDPENRYLSHSFVESPDMMNVYNGNAVLGEGGEVVVELPGYFEALNRDFRYQLTCIGEPAVLYIAETVSGNRFKIAGGKPGMEVSWQVTGIRKDPYAAAHPIMVEQEKRSGEKGLYLHPAEWGQPESKGTYYRAQ